MAKKIRERIVRPEGMGLMHDSRKDVRTLGKVINLLIDKHNELVDEIEELKAAAKSAKKAKALPIDGVGGASSDQVCQHTGRFQDVLGGKRVCLNCGEYI